MKGSVYHGLAPEATDQPPPPGRRTAVPNPDPRRRLFAVRLPVPRPARPAPVPGSLAGPGPVVSRNAPPLPRRARTAPPSRRLLAVRFPVAGSLSRFSPLPVWSSLVVFGACETIHERKSICRNATYVKRPRSKSIKKASKSAKIDQKRAKSIKNARISSCPS